MWQTGDIKSFSSWSYSVSYNTTSKVIYGKHQNEIIKGDIVDLLQKFKKNLRLNNF
jgi:hypothetical protein